MTAGAKDVTVVGGGVIGLAVAWRCAQRGLRVRVLDPSPGAGASHAAAGMLAPVGEAAFGEEALARLLLDSARRWPAFSAELTAATGRDLGYRTEGTLTVASTADDLAEAERLCAYHRGLGLTVTASRPSALRDREPALSPRIRGGAHTPDDHQVDPRRLVVALREVLGAGGVPIVAAMPTALSGVDGDVVVVAAGCGTARLAGLPVRPVKGQILRLRSPTGEPCFRHVIRGYVDGRHVYLVPRADGEVVVGATAEERADPAVTAGAVLELLRAAIDLIPELGEYELVETLVGFRPATPDNAPLLGRRNADPRIVVAAGHYRNGVVLTPVTADLIAGLIDTGVADPALEPFAPDRFGGAACA